MAWRNASRCIGRLYWRSLVVLDRRRARTADQIFSLLVHHLQAAGDASIRPVISIFAAAQPGQPCARVWNEQLIRYAGYRDEDGRTVGDVRQTAFTAAMRGFGWRGKGEQFDVLPLAIETPAEGVRLYELPERAIREVRLAHPEYGWFAELGLRWHAVPAIANMRLTIGGVHYPLAPFNGWYMGTEIGARNLADADRYDLLPVVAERMALDTSRESTLWRDRALVELNRAVLWSFERAGVKMADHHTESQRFLTHLRNEEKAGRPVPADWSWIVPPMSGGITSVFHRYYVEMDLRPAFYLDEEAISLAQDGMRGCPRQN
jgi:nitric-oxide synthase